MNGSPFAANWVQKENLYGNMENNCAFVCISYTAHDHFNVLT